ncbi:MAG: hypothetical protein NTV28_13420 [Propionibacteriales bacterium]|nr:hypothetical protein [Propionibacteriales bacterium]
MVLVGQVIAFAPPFEFWIWLGTATDQERDVLRSEDGLYERVRRIAEKDGLERLLKGVHVESQETVDREYEGSWSHAMR